MHSKIIFLRLCEGLSTGSMYFLTHFFGPHPPDLWMDTIYLIHWVASFMWHLTCAPWLLFADITMIRVVICARLYRFSSPSLCLSLPVSTGLVLYRPSDYYATALYTGLSTLYVALHHPDPCPYVISMTCAGVCWYLSHYAQQYKYHSVRSLLVTVFHLLLGYNALLEESSYRKMI